ncbi:unnamed protein product [Rhizophagus irregularis]|uniref:Uncharacterized protein n=1 Tax=Rhizophagus irregularis TaxID=588596 RepID=A0A2I1GFZ3_9GLOM|nr:hypothetical protein RhiirA4_542685 [Rhizophagus irregularis]CAB4422910.1 unnamed protein product [Rhizophagus irregularis]CAB4423149.1 unnamed protein product [Rhizophagus irregularis]
MLHIEYLDILQNHGSIINEQIKPSSLHEIDLKRENNCKAVEEYNDDIKNHQPFTCKCEKAANQCDKPTHFSANLAKSTTSHNEESSRWLPKQNSPILETENNTEDNVSFSELKKVNETLETRDEAYDEEKELLNKINEILKMDNRKIRDKVNKMRVNELNRDSKSHDFLLPCDEDTGCVCDFLQVYEKHASFDNNRCRMYENVNNDIPRINYVPTTNDSIHENEFRYLIRKYTPLNNIPRGEIDEPTRVYGNSFYNPACLNNENNTITNLEEQLTGASLEYWGNNSIGSVEHSLTQSEWNILKSSNESANWLQHSFNQSNWLRSNTSSPNMRQRDLYA